MGFDVVERKLGKAARFGGIFQRLAQIAVHRRGADQVDLHRRSITDGVVYRQIQRGFTQVQAAFEGFVGIVAEPRINRAVDELRGNAEQEHARQYRHQRKHPRQPPRNLRTEHTLAFVAHEEQDVARQNRCQHQHQQRTQGDNPPEIFRQRAGAARCNGQSVEQSHRRQHGNQEKAAHGLLLRDGQRLPAGIQVPVFRSQCVDLEGFGQLRRREQQADFGLCVFRCNAA